MKAGISLGLPLRQRTAVGRIQEAELKLEKLSLDLQLERQRVLTEVDDSVSAVRQTYQRYVAAMQELELARRLEQGERERFSLGDSTLFLVNQRERATAEAAVKVIALRAEYEQSLALFRAVTTQL
jgi:outer membrane protein TolC